MPHTPDCDDADPLDWWPTSSPTDIALSSLPAAGAVSSPHRLPGDGKWLAAWGDYAGLRIGISADGKSWPLTSGAVVLYPSSDCTATDLYLSADAGAWGSVSLARFKTEAIARSWAFTRAPVNPASLSGNPVQKSVRVLIAASPYTWNRPAGVDSLHIFLVGGGGGGGGALSTAGNHFAAGGGGGGGGIIDQDIAVAADAVITIGNFGAKGANTGTDGTSGSDTTCVVGATTYTAFGGGGGGGSAGTTGGAGIPNGKAGGSGGGAGNPAETGQSMGGSGGGAGGNATPITLLGPPTASFSDARGGAGWQGGAGAWSLDCTTESAAPGAGGPGYRGYGGGGGGGGADTAPGPVASPGSSGGGDGGERDAAGAKATNFGGGGGGGASSTAATGRTGGDGFEGIAILTWWE